MKNVNNCDEEKVNINQYQFECAIEMIDLGFIALQNDFELKYIYFRDKPLHIIVIGYQKLGLLDNFESLLIASFGL